MCFHPTHAYRRYAYKNCVFIIWNFYIYFLDLQGYPTNIKLFGRFWMYYDIHRPWDLRNLVLNSIEKVKPGSLLSLMYMFPESKGAKFLFHSFHLQNSGILQTTIDQRGDPMKTNFDIFQIQKWISQTVRAPKVDRKKSGPLSSFFFSFLSYHP